MKLTKEQSAMLEKNNLHLNAKEKEMLESLVGTDGKLNEEMLDNISGGKINIPPIVYKAAGVLGIVALGVAAGIGVQQVMRRRGESNDSASAPGAGAAHVADAADKH